MKLNYTPEYYGRLSGGVSDSARAVVPVVLKLVEPNSVVDLGCGTGIWLAEFKRQGVADLLGVDGPHIAVEHLQIDTHQFLAADLTQPLCVRRSFDLAMSLEVAEHLRADQADQLVETLTRLAPTVLFSAAIPHQGGEHHLNEQWPTYWVERFDARDFVVIDPFRRLLWERSDVDWWYAQNLVLFVQRDKLQQFPGLAAFANDPAGIAAFVHPRNYLQQAWQNQVLHVAVDLAANTRPGDQIILVDEDRFGSLYLPDRHVRPFLERDGAYFGPPCDDAQAISELERMIDEGCSCLAIGWPAFWWLNHFKGFKAHLEKHHPVVSSKDQVVLCHLQRSS